MGQKEQSHTSTVYTTEEKDRGSQELPTSIVGTEIYALAIRSTVPHVLSHYQIDQGPQKGAVNEKIRTGKS